MKTRFLIGLTFALRLSVIFSLLAGLLPFFSTGLQPVYAQDSADKKFWVFYPVNIKGIENAGEYQNIAQALLKRGYRDGDVAKIMGENLLRVFDEVVRIARN